MSTQYVSIVSSKSLAPSDWRIERMFVYARELSQFSLYVPSQLSGHKPWMLQSVPSASWG